MSRLKPSVSVMLPNYNHGRYIARALSSLVNQSPAPTELVVIDDGSTDDSVAVIQPFVASYPFIRFIRYAHNRGVMAIIRDVPATLHGDYIYFAAADDYVLPGFFSQALAWARRYPEAGLVFGQIQAVSEHGDTLYRFGAGAWPHALYASPRRFRTEYLEAEAAGQSLVGSTIFKRTALTEVGGLRPELGSWCDSFAVRAIGLRWGVCYVPQAWMTWTVHKGSLSHASARHLQHMFTLIRRGGALMRSLEFRPYFPEDHVRRWERGYRLIAAEQFLLSFLPWSMLTRLSRSSTLRRWRTRSWRTLSRIFSLGAAP